MSNNMTFSLSAGIEADLQAATEKWRQDGLIGKIWNRDASVWTGADESKWLGWLDIVTRELGDLQKYRDLKTVIEQAGFTDILLMGMGGSSRVPEFWRSHSPRKFSHSRFDRASTGQNYRS